MNVWNGRYHKPQICPYFTFHYVQIFDFMLWFDKKKNTQLQIAVVSSHCVVSPNCDVVTLLT